MLAMTTYKYTRSDGGINVSPIKPPCEYTTAVRLVADSGKTLTRDGVTYTQCIDVDSADGWYEVDEPNDVDAQDMRNALDILGVKP